MNKRWLRIHLKLVALATSIALLFLLIRTALAILWAIETQDLSLATSELLTYFTVGLATLIVAWRYGLNPLLAGLVGYLYIWITLVVINESVAIAAWRRSFLTLIVLLTVVPWPVALSALIGALIGNILRWIGIAEPLKKN